MASITLYSYWRSSCSYRVRIALAIKGVAYETVPVNIVLGEQFSEEHKARNPIAHVPCLIVDGKPFIESVAICELLEDLFPEPALFPKDPFARARLRAVVELVNAGIQPLQNLVVLNKVADSQEGRVAWARTFNERGLAAVEALLAQYEKEGIKGKYAFGDSLTAADVCLVPQVYSARRFGVDLSAFPRVATAAASAEADPRVASAAPDRQIDAPRS